MDRSLGVVIPAYRPDAAVLGDYVRAIDASLDPTDIRIELDCPVPGVRAALADLPATVGVAETRRGKGAAITDGFEQLDTDVLAFADADGSTPADSLGDVIDPVRTGEADLAVGSRRHPDATVHSHQTYVRRWMGNAFAALARLMLSVSLYDYQCGAKAIDRTAWESVRGHLYEPGFAWDVELIAMTAALEYRIVEVPVVWDDQPGSTVDPIETAVALGRAVMIARHRAKLLSDHPLHSTIESFRDDEEALVDRPRPNDD